MAYNARIIKPSIASPKPKPYSFPYGVAGGVNYNVSADQINSDQSPKMLNMNYRAGRVPSKRYGYDKVNDISWGETPIRGEYIYRKTDGSSVFLFAHGGIIYNLNVSTGEKTSLMSLPATIADTDTYFFTMNDICYIYNGSGLYQYTGIGTVTAVVGYIPTITLGRSPSGGGAAFEELNYLSDSWIDSFSSTTDATDYVVSFNNITSCDSVTVDGEVKTEGIDYTVDLITGTVSFGAGLGVVGTDNVKIQCTKDGLMNKTFITQCTQFVIYGGRNDTRVFACRGNTRYHSGLLDPTYWPEINYAVITSDAENITSMGRMLDYLVLFKERSLHYTYVSASDYGNVEYPVLPLNDEFGCIAKDSVQPVNNGLLFLASTDKGAPAGVCWLSPSLVRNQLNVRIISDNINRSIYADRKGILDNSLSELQGAKSYIWDDKYWLKIGDICWILDLKESNFSEGKFVWYPYNGIPAQINCFLEHEKNLYIGTNTGMIYKNNESFNDAGNAIVAYWTSPILFMDYRSWIKKFEKLYLTFGGQTISSHLLTLITDENVEEVSITYTDTRAFEYGTIDYSVWTYGANPYPSTEVEKVGYKGEYLQWEVKNNQLDENLVILAQKLSWSLVKEVR